MQFTVDGQPRYAPALRRDLRRPLGSGNSHGLDDADILELLLGSRLIDRQSQNMTVAARATAERKVLAHLS